MGKLVIRTLDIFICTYIMPLLIILISVVKSKRKEDWALKRVKMGKLTLIGLLDSFLSTYFMPLVVPTFVVKRSEKVERKFWY